MEGGGWVAKGQLLTSTTELKIRKDTERGDNDSIKMPNGKSVVIDGKTCCSS